MADVVVSAGPVAHEEVAPPAPLDFEIVPRKGLPIVALAFVALIVAIAVDKLWPVEFLHVVFGSAWTVIDLFLGLVLGPIMGRMPIPARVALTTRLMPKMLLIMPTVVTITLAAGWQLGRLLGTTDSAYYNHHWVVASYIVVGVMAIIALGLLEPANVAVLVELKKPQPRPQVIETLMKRFIFTAGILGVLQIATYVIMTKIATG
jgi:MFS family permease